MEKNWTRTNSSFIQTNIFSRNHFTVKTKNKKERERKKERESQTNQTKQSKQISPEKEHSTGTLDQEGKMTGKHENREKPLKRCRCSAGESAKHLMLLNQNQQVKGVIF